MQYLLFVIKNNKNFCIFVYVYLYVLFYFITMHFREHRSRPNICQKISRPRCATLFFKLINPRNRPSHERRPRVRWHHAPQHTVRCRGNRFANKPSITENCQAHKFCNIKSRFKDGKINPLAGNPSASVESAIRNLLRIPKHTS